MRAAEDCVPSQPLCVLPSRSMRRTYLDIGLSCQQVGQCCSHGGEAPMPIGLGELVSSSQVFECGLVPSHSFAHSHHNLRNLRLSSMTLRPLSTCHLVSIVVVRTPVGYLDQRRDTFERNHFFKNQD